MSLTADGFRDFGIDPQELPAPPNNVRCFLTTGRFIAQYVAVGVGLGTGVGLAALLALTMPFPLNLLGTAATLASFAACAFALTKDNYRWIELDGNTLRAKRLYTGATIVRSVEEISWVILYPYRTLAVIEAIFAPVKGVEIRFCDGRTPIRVVCTDRGMTNLRELIEAVLYRMRQGRNVDAEVANFAGAPVLRDVQAATRVKGLTSILAGGMSLGLLFGLILGYWGRQEHRRISVASLPPKQVALQDLIENGPGTHAHIEVTDFHFGGYVVQSKSGSWSRVWIALFPKAAASENHRRPKDIAIKAVLESSTINNVAELNQFVRRGRVTGDCASEPRSYFGLVLGPELIKANSGTRLVSAYVIEDLSEPPSAALVQRLFLSSGACYAVAVVCAVITFIKGFLN